MTRSITFQVSAASFDPELHKALREARAAFEKAQGDLIRKFQKSDRFQAACDAAGYGQSVSKSAPTVGIGGDYLCVSFYVDEFDASAPAYQAIQIDPKLANTLLHGKLLSDGEKRALVRGLVPGLKLEAAE